MERCNWDNKDELIGVCIINIHIYVHTCILTDCFVQKIGLKSAEFKASFLILHFILWNHHDCV